MQRTTGEWSHNKGLGNMNGEGGCLSPAITKY